MIENILLTYGPLGAWTCWLIYEKQKILSGVRLAMEQNTKVLNKLLNKLS